jgi:hypothetical protein
MYQIAVVKPHYNTSIFKYPQPQQQQQQQQLYYYQPYNNNNNKIIRKQIIINRPAPPKKNSESISSTNDSSNNTSSTENNTIAKPSNDQKNSFNKRYKHNRELLYYLTSGDIIEYSKHHEVWNENDRLWAIYAGNGYVIRFDKQTGMIVSEAYWNLANYFYMTRSVDTDRNYYCLHVQLVVNRAHYALQNNYVMKNLFSSDKNFVMWCRYDINKSDVEFSTNMNKCPTEANKFIMITRFLECVEKHQSEQLAIKNDEVEEEGK